MDVIRVHNTNLTFKFTHDLQGPDEVRKAVQYARARLMQDAVRLNYNVLLSEGYALPGRPFARARPLTLAPQMALHAPAQRPPTPRRGRLQRPAGARAGKGNPPLPAALHGRARSLRASIQESPGPTTAEALPQLQLSVDA